jgi:hypothetical protein
MTTTDGRYKERRVNGLIWDKYPSDASTYQIEGASTSREESVNGHLTFWRDSDISR